MDTGFLKIFNKISATLSIISTTLTSFFGMDFIFGISYIKYIRLCNRNYKIESNSYREF